MARRIIKCKIRKTRTKERTTFKYPTVWRSNRVNVVAYEAAENLGDVSEYCVGVVEEEDLPGFLESEDIEEITIEEANTLGRAWKPQRISVSDADVAILALRKPTGKRSEKEKEALDPDKDEPGINRTPLFDIQRYLK